MTKEQEKAIEVLNKSLAIGDFVTTNWVEIEIATRTVLNLIQTQQNDTQRMQELLDLSDANNVKKDKIIDEMAKYIEILTVDLKIPIGENVLWNIEGIKQYFERKITSNKQIQ